MHIKDYISLILLIFIPILTAQCQQTNNYCQYYYDQLKEIPHENLDYRSGTITFSWDNKEYTGCEITFVTNDSLLVDSPRLPRFTRGPDPALRDKGWQHNINYDADGPGSRLYGVEKEDAVCLINYSQPTTLEEPGKIVQDTKLTITAECVDRNRE